MEKSNKTTKHIITNTERKTSGSNWSMYKNLISKPKTERKSNEGNNTSQTRRHPKSLKMHATSHHAVSTQDTTMSFKVTYTRVMYLYIY